MQQDKYSQILQAIKEDNLVVFSSLIKGNKSLSFGRFPILSLCYLYNAKKIIKNFEIDLLKIKTFIFAQEPIFLYKDFKIVAGKCMRLYLSDGAVVLPLEMLALMHKDKKLKKLFNSNKTFISSTDNLKKIYTIYGQNVDIKDDKIKISKAKLTYKQKKSYKLAIILATSCLAFISICMGIFGLTTGFGTNICPFVVCSQTQLSKALKTNGNYVLSSNITVTDFLSDSTFSGTLDGKNKTLFIDDTSLNYLVLQNKGIIKNLNIVYKNIDRQTSSGFSLLANKNFGTIQNVNIVTKDITINVTKNQNSEIYINGFANINSGKIKNCTLSTNMQVSASGSGECFVSGFVGKNIGKIENCIFNKNSNITTLESDLSGIVTTNEFGATIEKSKNYATLTQNSTENGWNPNVAGIVQTNYGETLNCYNFATLTNLSLNENQSISGEAYLGGICAMNYNKIYKCLNKGNLVASSKNIIIYCGGISAYSYRFVNNQKVINSVINNCGVDCKVSVTTEHNNAYAFVGGVCGLLYGESTNCYSVANYTTGFDSTKYFVGSYLGSAYTELVFDGSQIKTYIRVTIANDFVLAQSNITYQIASLISGNQIMAGIDSPNEEIKTLSSLDQIKEQGVYFDE